MEKLKSNPLESAKVSKLMIKFAVPSIIAMLVGAIYNIVDQLFIGQAVGQLGNAATNIAFPFSTACISIALLFGIGGASCFNLAMGRGEKEKAPYFLGNSLVLLSFCGLVLTVITLCFLTPLLKACGSPDDVLPYAQEYVKITALGFPFMILTTGGGHLIRADGNPAMTMICSLVGAIINTILDAIFVLKFNMGMAGAAYATIIGQVISAVIVIVYFLIYSKTKLNIKHLKFNLKYSFKIMSIGMASFFNQIAIMIVQIVLNNVLKHYGALSIYGESIPIACSGIVMKVNQLIFSIVIGLAQGTQPIQSFNYGAKNFKRVKEAYRIALFSSAIISILSFIAFQIFPREILGLFGEGEEMYFELGEKFFRIFLFLTWANCLQPITATFFTSIGKPIKGVFLSLTRQIIFFLPLLIILPKFFGINGVLYTGPIADLIAAIIAISMAAFEFKNMSKVSSNNDLSES